MRRKDASVVNGISTRSEISERSWEIAGRRSDGATARPHALRFRWNLLVYKALADLRAEARRYYISYLWWVLEPAIEMAIFYLVFAVLLNRGGPNYVHFLLVGLVSWKWFEATVRHCGASIIQNRALILKVPLPKIFFPTVVVVTDTVKAMVSMGLMLLFVSLSGFPPGWPHLMLPVLWAVQLLLILAVGYGLAAVTPFFPDLMLIVTHLLRIVFFLSGIFFRPDLIPEKLRFWFFLNPMARVVEDYRMVLLDHQWPKLAPLALISAGSVLVIVGAVRFIRRFDQVYPRVVNQ
jgi:lipopolysaccharide transport system permease protein